MQKCNTEKSSHVRDSRLDYIRTLALLMIITVHTWSLAGVQAYPYLDSLYHAFEDCGVPLFVMLSGALVLAAPISSIGAFYRKRLKRVLLPFLGWSLVVYAIGVGVGKYADIHTLKDALLCYIPYLMTNKINYAYWFVQLIVVLYLLTPLLQPVVKSLGQKQWLWLLGAWLVLMVIRDTAPSLYFVRYTSDLLQHIGYYLAGYYIYHHVPVADKKVRTAAMGVLVLSVVCCVAMLPLAVFWRIAERLALFVVLLGITRIKERKWVRLCSNQSYNVYLIHFLFITPIYKLLHFAGDAAPLWQCILIPAATTLAIALVCNLFFWIAAETMLLVGKRQNDEK